ncbi:MAG: LON peptidase substrate-binding domain-containing protein, partial [Burkholderiales bacterium]
MTPWPRLNKLLGGDAAQADAAPRAPVAPAAAKPLPEDAIALVPVRNIVLFPGVLAPVTIGREKSVAAAQEAAKHERRVGFLLQRDPKIDAPTPEDLYWVGTAGQILRYVTSPAGAHHLVVQGQTRFRVLEFLEGWPYLVARVAWIEEPSALTPEIEARFLQLKQHAVEAVGLLPHAPDELGGVVEGVDSPAALADMVANLLDVKPEEKQALLETFALELRLDRVLELLSQRVEVLRISKEIGEQTKKAFDDRQREHVLREQMRQIQKELGEDEDDRAELEELKKAIESASMPEEVAKHARKELKRLQRMHES